MEDDNRSLRLYDDLAWLWPIWGSPEHEYARYCSEVADMIRKYAAIRVQSLLNIGCGGGKNAFNLKRDFDVTGVDLAPKMLELARELNPECQFLSGDMRSLYLGRRFDAILMDDSVGYMTNRVDLESAFREAYQHLNSGGVMVVTVDETTETFIQNRTCTTQAEGKTRRGSVEAVFIENYYDPDPRDETYEGTFLYLVREEGRLRIETDHHVLGLFPLSIWRDTLVNVGFTIHEEIYVDDEREYTTFVCVKAMP
jgi:SAM-dependent methyltransferase